jgi:predicted transcriptional regulator of viral defense system
MNAREALARLRGLRVSVVETADAAAVFEQSTFAASKTLSRLAESGLITRIRPGVFWTEGNVDPYRLAEHLTSPMPTYVSLQTALHLRGIIEQIPTVIYAVSLARTQSIKTTVASYSIHHVAPVLFGGFERTREGVLLATTEKALFDLAYLSGGRTRMFSHLPELELPRAFRWKELGHWVGRIASSRHRTLTKRRLVRLLANRTHAAPAAWFR